MPPPMDSRIGLYITDGTVTWIVDDVRDGTPVGSIRGSLYLPKGYIKANGATVNRADYPRLVKWINDNNLWTDDMENYQGLFGKGDGKTTFVLPKWTEKIIWFSDIKPGEYLKAGLPNIKGYFNLLNSSIDKNGIIPPFLNGNIRNIQAGNNYTITNGMTGVNFDASSNNDIYGSSSTVRPPNNRLIPIIRY